MFQHCSLVCIWPCERCCQCGIHACYQCSGKHHQLHVTGGGVPGGTPQGPHRGRPASPAQHSAARHRRSAARRSAQQTAAQPHAARVPAVQPTSSFIRAELAIRPTTREPVDSESPPPPCPAHLHNAVHLLDAVVPGGHVVHPGPQGGVEKFRQVRVLPDDGLRRGEVPGGRQLEGKRRVRGACGGVTRSFDGAASELRYQEGEVRGKAQAGQTGACACARASGSVMSRQLGALRHRRSAGATLLRRASCRCARQQQQRQRRRRWRRSSSHAAPARWP